MLETLYELSFPPGLQNNGTTFQSRGRWHVGSLVRFFEKKIQPVGGWVRRTTTGATIAGTPNAAISWLANDGSAFLAIGTTTNLYVVTSANVVSDITPATVVGDGLTHLWQLETFGTWLVATFQRAAYVDTAVINAFVWKGVTSVVAIPAYDSTTGPGSVYGNTVTPERFIVLLRGADPTTFPAETASGVGGTSGTSGTDGSGGVSGGTGGGSAPTETPPAPTLTSPRADRAVATWTNNNHVASVRIEWSTAPTFEGPYTVTQTTERSPESATDSFFNSTGANYAKARLQYFNATGNGPWGGLSNAQGLG